MSFRRTKTLDKDFHRQAPGENVQMTRRHAMEDVSDDGIDPSSSDDDDDDEMPEEIQRYMEQFGATRGTTGDALREWHKQYALKLNRKEGDPPPSHCKAGCHWNDGEFSTGCVACLEASTAISDK